jgi:hypothetical protein
MELDSTGRQTTKSSAIGWLFRFRLRTLLVLVAFLAVLVAWWRDRSQLSQQLRQSELLREMTLPDIDERILLEKRLLDQLHEFDHEIWRELRFASGDENATSSSSAPHVVSMLVDSSRAPEDRAYWAQMLGGEHGDEVLSALVEALKAEPVVRQSAVTSLGRWGRSAASATGALKLGLADSPSPLAARTIWALWRIDPTLDLLPRIEELLEDDEAEARCWAAYTLIFSDYARAPLLLTGMLRDRDARVRLIAAYGVMNTAPKDQAVRTLLDAGTDESDPRVQSCIRVALQLLELGRQRRQREEIEQEYRAKFPEKA